ncbi:hypothetical protein EB118_08245 [bacterium]|nr:hypothetical protein [bacterium]
MSSKESQDWIYDIIPAKQVEEIESKQAETERYLRDRVEELEVTLEALRAELRIAQQELWKREPQ